MYRSLLVYEVVFLIIKFAVKLYLLYYFFGESAVIWIGDTYAKQKV
jgi:hypothetical protein